MEAGKADVERRWPFFAPDPALGNKVGREHNEITRRGRTNKRDNKKSALAVSLIHHTKEGWVARLTSFCGSRRRYSFLLNWLVCSDFRVF